MALEQLFVLADVKGTQLKWMWTFIIQNIIIYIYTVYSIYIYICFKTHHVIHQWIWCEHSKHHVFFSSRVQWSKLLEVYTIFHDAVKKKQNICVFSGSTPETKIIRHQKLLTLLSIIVTSETQTHQHIIKIHQTVAFRQTQKPLSVLGPGGFHFHIRIDVAISVLAESNMNWKEQLGSVGSFFDDLICFENWDLHSISQHVPTLNIFYLSSMRRSYWKPVSSISFTQRTRLSNNGQLVTCWFYFGMLKFLTGNNWTWKFLDNF